MAAPTLQLLTPSCRPGMGGALLPRRCTAMDGVDGAEKCKSGSYVVLGDRSTYVDQQTLKLQVGLGLRI